MKRLVLSLLGAALLAVGAWSAPASAGTILDPVFAPQLPLGDNLIVPSLNGSVYTAGHTFGSHHTFTDTVSFTVNAATSLALQILTWGNISWNITLQSGSNMASLTSISAATGTIAGHTGTVLTELLSLNTTGSWLLTISGTACSCAGYAITLAQAAVTPIPPALLMFLTGLGGLGGLAWRRRKGAPAKVAFA